MNKTPVKQSLKKRLIQGVFLFLVLLASWWSQQNQKPEINLSSETNNALEEAISQQHSDVMVQFKAEVIKLLADDLKGSKHQKFIVKSNIHTLLIAHNIDLAPRVPIKLGDELNIRGEYEWNDRGGVVHWTHHDPQNRRVGGWIELNGKKFK